MPSAKAMTFCTDYATHCGFTADKRYDDMADCLKEYDMFPARQMCKEMHLGFVKMKMGTADYEPYKTMHCPHATSLDGNCMQ